MRAESVRQPARSRTLSACKSIRCAHPGRCPGLPCPAPSVRNLLAGRRPPSTPAPGYLYSVHSTLPSTIVTTPLWNLCLRPNCLQLLTSTPSDDNDKLSPSKLTFETPEQSLHLNRRAPSAPRKQWSNNQF